MGAVTIYAESTYPVRKDLEAIHEKQISALGEPGIWGSGAQRLAIAQEARAAGYTAGVQEFDHEVYEQAIADGLSDAFYTEIVGLVSRISNFDVLLNR